MRVAVVGNGHLSEADRDHIRNTSNHTFDRIIRFNDMNSWQYGEVVDIRVTRIPSGFSPIFPYHATEEWYVTVDPGLVPHDAARIIVVYERSREQENTLRDRRMFPACGACGVHCLHSWASMGPSTGAAVIDTFEQDDDVKRIDVFGMNWNGNLPHNDFLDRTIVERCCAKCTVHPTPDSTYGNEIGKLHTIMMMSALLMITMVFGCVCWLVRKRRMRHHNLLE